MAEKIKENLLTSMFRCENFAATCVKDTENPAPGLPPVTTLKICSRGSEPLLFSYVPGAGLCQTGPGGAVIEKNILGQLRGLKDDDIDQYVGFFEKYGFLFPVSPDVYDSVPAETIIAFVDHIKATMRLMNAIAKRDYKSILINTSYLLYSEQVELTVGDKIYSTCAHEFTTLVHSFTGFPDLSRDKEAFNTGKHTFPDTLVPGYAVDIKMFNNVRSGYAEPLFQHLFAMYTGLPNVSNELRTIIDFFFHYQMEVGMFSEISYGSIKYHDQKQQENFTEPMQAALLDIARIVIAEEINYNIAGIHPVYNRNLTATWELETLLQAMYFSIFYMKAGVEIYKECANPNCKREKFFLVSSTRANKEYCCTQCARAAAAQRYRNNHPELKTKK